METRISSRGQVVLPAEARRKLRLGMGERLAVELRDGGMFLRPLVAPRRYRMMTDTLTGLPVMRPVARGGRKVTPAEIARLQAELL
jgi:AbrB family looped-hinge helix DNA binding protein